MDLLHAENKMTARTNIEEVLRCYPTTSRGFVRHRIACPGCAIAPFGTLHDAATEYQLSLDLFLQELNETIREFPSGKEGLA